MSVSIEPVGATIIDIGGKVDGPEHGPEHDTAPSERPSMHG